MARSVCALAGFGLVCGCVLSRLRWCRPVKSRSSVMSGWSWLMNPEADAWMSMYMLFARARSVIVGGCVAALSSWCLWM
eukprot:3643711-Prorocentrum_lima.AAC.1